MQISENQIQRFFDQQCSAEEARTVASYLQEHPLLIEKWLGPDWKQAGKEIPVPSLYREEIFRQVTKELRFKKKRESGQIIQMLLSVAAILVLMLTGWWFFKNEYHATKEPKLLSIAPAAASMQWRVNTTTKPLEVLLPDHSVAIIDPGTKIQFEKNFSGIERRILLIGSGFFNVKKNTTQPFIVESGQITTTALGTSFRVAEHKEGVTVKLYTGKVVINKIGSTKNWGGPVYLLPGTAMTFSARGDKTTVFRFILEQDRNPIVKKKDAQQQASVLPDDMNFDNTPLEQVLKAIEKRYAVMIGYDHQHISGRYFTGKVLPTDSIEVLLKVIGNINDLSIRREGDHRFSITKHQ